MARDRQLDDIRTTKTKSPSTDQQSVDPERLATFFIDAATSRIKRISSHLMVELGGYKAFDDAAQWCARHPYIAICLVAGACTILPFILLIGGVVLSTVALTFTGFLFVEGTLLTIISIVIFACVGGLAIVLLVFAVIFVAGYFGFVHIYDLYGREQKSALLNFLRNEQCGGVRVQNEPECADSNNTNANVS